jgi:excisionase family DNA binding protein
MRDNKNKFERKFLTIRQLSESSGISVTQLRRLVHAGRIPFFQPGGKKGKLLFPRDAIERSGQMPHGPQADSSPLAGRRPSWMADQN